MMIIIISIIAVLVDQYSKILAVNKLSNGSFPIINDVLHFTYVENTGAAFGLFQNGNAFLIFTTLIILLAVIFIIFKYKPAEKILKVSLALITGGALGNLIDRLLRGFVVDFIDFRIINYPVFNFADCFVVTGAILFAVYIIFFDNKKKEEIKDEK